MNKLTANFSLYTITFFSAIQYVFLANVPDSVSSFAFLSVTNFIGFFITLSVFSGELKRLDKEQVLQAFLLSLELIGFNIFLLLGSRETDATTTACVLSTYFVFIVLLLQLFFHERPDRYKRIGILVVFIGVFFMMDADIMSLFNRGVLFLVISDIFFAAYLLTVERYASSSNPSVIAMGQTFFNFLIATVCWGIEAALLHVPFALPKEPKFWGSVFFISFFIRGLYGIVQIYAQRYVSSLNVALIFSTEIIMTMLFSPILARIFNTQPEVITPLRLLGALVMVFGILISDREVAEKLRKGIAHGQS
ncbi:MAG: DMT family transporter [Lachnospiraceae bacterium]|nr:DMT family transporter [Lachnospiraceae bacterium]